MVRNFDLTEAEKADIRLLVDRELRGRKWWNKYISTSRAAKDREKVLYAVWYSLTEYCGYRSPREFLSVSDELLNKLKLYAKIENVIMREVPEIDGVDMSYVVRLLFPKYYKEDDQDFKKRLIQNYYSSVLDGTKTFPKHYFDKRLYNNIAVSRAQTCLEYMLDENYSSISEAYKAFASNGIISKLRAANLEGACKQCEYILPIDFLHDTVYTTPKHTEDDELLYQELRCKQVLASFQMEDEQPDE